MMGVLGDVIERTLAGFGERLAGFAPNLLAMLVILLCGLVVAVSLRAAVRLLLPRLGFDRFAQRIGLTLMLERGGIAGPASSLVAQVLAWSVLAVFVLLAIAALDLGIAMDLLSRSFLYLPQILIALAILALGSLLAALLRRSVLIGAVNAGLPAARLLATLTHTALMVLFSAMALEHLGVGRQVLLISFTILFGGVVFALALAFGLGGRDLAREALERLLLRRGSDDDERRHL